MRRIVAALAAIVALAMAAPVWAAPAIDLGGSLETTFQVTPAGSDNNGITATSDLRLNFSMEMASGQQIRAFVGFEPIEYAPFGPSTDPNPGSDALAGGNMDAKGLTPVTLGLAQLTIEKAYLETTGPFLTGGQDVTTRLGDLAVDYSPYIAHVSETDGVIEGAQVSGVRVGPVELGAFYGWATRQISEDQQERFANAGVAAAADIQGIGLTGAAVKTGDDIALAGTVRFAPVPGLDLTGAAAWDGSNEAAVVKAEAGIAELPVLPGVSAKLGVRDFDPKFNPIYRDDRKDDDGNDINVVDLNAGKRGVNGEVATTVMGVELVGTADWHQQRNADRQIVGERKSLGATAATRYAGLDIEAGVKTTWSTVNADYSILERQVKADPEMKTLVTLGLGYDVPVGPIVVNTEYDLTMSNIDSTVHELAASTVFDAPMLSGIELSGNAKWANGQMAYIGQAEYTAPNGIEFIGSYAKYDEGNFGDFTSRPNGFCLTAGMKVEF
ncbi:MAG: hypothetical protein NUW12_04100 [Firmicutes bacterium]|jgi:hypothetical protein|nr:hypothetical protein [Bacillota bacterium]MDH7495128.1 hypothetical protein [Bacillota bacterium]